MEMDRDEEVLFVHVGVQKPRPQKRSTKDKKRARRVT